MAKENLHHLYTTFTLIVHSQLQGKNYPKPAWPLVKWEAIYQLLLGSMTRTPFDQLSKQLMEELLSPYGQVHINKEVLGEARYIDLWFSPLSGGVRPCYFNPGITGKVNHPSVSDRAFSKCSHRLRVGELSAQALLHSH